MRISRRGLLFGLLGTSAHAALPKSYGLQRGWPMAGGQADFLTPSTLRGIGQSVATPWSNPVYGMTPARSSSLKAAGFNGLRVFVDGVAQMAAYAVSQAALDALVAQHVAIVANGIADGYRMVVSYAVDPSTLRLDIQNPAGALYPRWMAICATMGAALWAAFGESVIFEPMNEFSTRSAISGAGYPDYYNVFCLAVRNAVRATAPLLYLSLQSTDFGVSSFLQYFTNTTLLGDGRVIFSFHCYDPGEFTHEGQAGQTTFGIENLNWPVPATAGGITQAKADAATRVNASGLTAPQKAVQIAANNATLDNLFTPGGIGTPSYPLGLLATMDTWAATYGIPASRQLCTEYGAVSQFNSDGTGGMTTEARAAYEKMIRLALEARNIGWLVYQAVGDLNHFQQTSLTAQGSVLIPDLTLALGRPGVQSRPAWVPAGALYAADMLNGRYWLAATETNDLRLAIDFDRASERFAKDAAGVWRRMLPYLPARTDLGLSIEPAFSGPSLTVAKVPTSLSAASTTFAAGLQNFGAVAGYTCAQVDASAALVASGYGEAAPLGLVYEITNTTGSNKFLQFQGGAISAVPQVGSWVARKTAGAGVVQLGKSSGGGTNKQSVALAATFDRYTFTDTGTGAMEVTIPTGVTLQFIIPALEYKAGAPASSLVLGPSRAADQAAVPAFSALATMASIMVDIGAGLVPTTYAALSTMLAGGDVQIRTIVAG